MLNFMRKRENEILSLKLALHKLICFCCCCILCICTNWFAVHAAECRLRFMQSTNYLTRDEMKKAHSRVIFSVCSWQTEKESAAEAERERVSQRNRKKTHAREREKSRKVLNIWRRKRDFCEHFLLQIFVIKMK